MYTCKQAPEYIIKLNYPVYTFICLLTWALFQFHCCLAFRSLHHVCIILYHWQCVRACTGYSYHMYMHVHIILVHAMYMYTCTRMSISSWLCFVFQVCRWVAKIFHMLRRYMYVTARCLLHYENKNKWGTLYMYSAGNVVIACMF